jgi:hypothetical protein
VKVTARPESAETGEQRDCAEAFVLIIAKVAREMIRRGRPIRRCGGQRLYTGLLVIGHRDDGRLF